MKTQIKNRQFDFVLFILIIGLLGVGMLMLGSSSFVRGSYLSDDSMHFMRNQIVNSLLGIAVMIGASFVNYKIYKRFAGYVFIVVLFMNYITAVVGQVRNDASRWLKIGPVSFQPSEILKIALILYLSAVLSDAEWGERSKGITGFLTIILPVVAALLAVVLQKHISATIIIALIGIAVMFYAGVKWYVFALTIGGGLAFGSLAFLVKPDLFEHVMTRINVYLVTFGGNTLAELPEGISEASVSQIRASILAIGSGGMWGLGFGKSIQKYSYLPEAYNDFIFAVTAEELGFAGVVAIIILFAIFIVRGFKVASSCEDSFGSLLSGGIMTMLAIQTVLNISVVSALIPVTGVSLPFFSYGGSAIIIILGSMGVLLNIAKQSNYSKIGPD